MCLSARGGWGDGGGGRRGVTFVQMKCFLDCLLDANLIPVCASSGVGRTTAFRGLRGTARTGRLRRLQGLLPGSEDDSTRAASRREKSGEDAMRPR